LVSDHIPLNDFDVNALTLEYDKNSEDIMIIRSFPSENADKIKCNLMQAVKEKRTNITREYLKLIATSEAHFNYVYENYIVKGWKITYKVHWFDASSYMSSLSFRKWVYNVNLKLIEEETRAEQLSDIYQKRNDMDKEDALKIFNQAIETLKLSFNKLL